MRSKEDMLDGCLDVHFYGRSGREDVLDVMERYAKEVAIDFAKCVDANGWTQLGDGNWGSLSHSTKSSEELYTEYLKQKQ
jgi:hypothetical protein